MPADLFHQALRVAPDDHDLQRMLNAMIAAPGVRADTRNLARALISRSVNPAPDVVADVPSWAEESRANYFAEAPVTDQYLQLLAAETDPFVLRRALSRDLPDEVMTNLLGTVNLQDLSELLETENAKAVHVVAALRRLCGRDPNTGTFRKPPTLLLRSGVLRARRADIAELVVGDETLPPTLWLYAAWAPGWTEQERVAILSTALHLAQTYPHEATDLVLTDLVTAELTGSDEETRLLVQECFRQFAGQQATSANSANSANSEYLLRERMIGEGVGPYTLFGRLGKTSLIALIGRVPKGDLAAPGVLATLLVKNLLVDDDVLAALTAAGLDTSEQALLEVLTAGKPAMSRMQDCPDWIRDRPLLLAGWLVCRIGSLSGVIASFTPSELQQVQAQLPQALQAHRPATKQLAELLARIPATVEIVNSIPPRILHATLHKMKATTKNHLGEVLRQALTPLTQVADPATAARLLHELATQEAENTDTLSSLGDLVNAAIALS